MKTAVLGLILAVLLSACAKKGRPGGGPEDKSGPFVERWSPVAGEDGVPPERSFQMTWSEPVQHASVDDNLFVSPDTAVIDKTWDGRTLSLTPRGGWLPDVSHWVWIGAGVLDRQALPMEEPFGVWFSTGADTGASAGISGATLLDNAPAAGVIITVSQAGSPLQWTCLSGADGSFQAPELASGQWRLTAFADRDRNRRYHRGTEPWAGASLSMPADSGAPLRLVLSPEDIIAPILRDVRAEHSRRIRLGFSEPLGAAPDSAFALLDTSGARHDIESVCLSAADPAGVRLLLARPLRDDPMRISVSGVRDSADLAGADTMVAFMGTSLADTVAPEVYRLLYDVTSPPRFWLMFTEPMDTASAEDFLVLDVPTLSPVEGRAAWVDPQVLAWSANTSPPSDHRLLTVLAGASDRAGLPLVSLIRMMPVPADSVLPSWEPGRVAPSP
ncbi:MAG: Ig-like domain-containing protein [Candidatus Eisenbacteria bacterium]|nr:Ig-like domain-containing protein [Candidatus Eisenbacteria bacterium]